MLMLHLVTNWTSIAPKDSQLNNTYINRYTDKTNVCMLSNSFKQSDLRAEHAAVQSFGTKQ